MPVLVVADRIGLALAQDAVALEQRLVLGADGEERRRRDGLLRTRTRMSVVVGATAVARKSAERHTYTARTET